MRVDSVYQGRNWAIPPALVLKDDLSYGNGVEGRGMRRRRYAAVLTATRYGSMWRFAGWPNVGTRVLAPTRTPPSWGSEYPPTLTRQVCAISRYLRPGFRGIGGGNGAITPLDIWRYSETTKRRMLIYFGIWQAQRGCAPVSAGRREGQLTVSRALSIREGGRG